MYHAFDHLPELVINPHQAYQRLVKNKTKLVPLRKLKGETSAVMILPYPPGIPLIMPGERITEQSKVILDLLYFVKVNGFNFLLDYYIFSLSKDLTDF